MEVILNRSAGGFPYELHLDVRVDGEDVYDAADSVAEYVTDHAEEVLKPMYPDKMDYPEPTRRSRQWLEEHLAYAVNLMSQVWDQVGGDTVVATAGPKEDPDRFDVPDFITEVRRHYPKF